jgi:hypothetical protein
VNQVTDQARQVDTEYPDRRLARKYAPENAYDAIELLENDFDAFVEYVREAQS